MSAKIEATVEDLYHVPEHGKAEIVNGEIVLMPPTGDMPSRAGLSVVISLRSYEGKTPGRAYPDNAAFLVHLPNRRSFSPDAAWHLGPSTGMKFLEGAPAFAVEVRSEGDYGRSAEREMAEKRADYFAAGTLVVWDVDLLSPDVVKSYNAADPDTPKIFGRGEVADAEAAVPGWKIPVDELFS
jgi:Uma2 family endonuclease